MFICFFIVLKNAIFIKKNLTINQYDGRMVVEKTLDGGGWHQIDLPRGSDNMSSQGYIFNKRVFERKKKKRKTR